MHFLDQDKSNQKQIRFELESILVVKILKLVERVVFKNKK
jgi:hypothetical protein